MRFDRVRLENFKCYADADLVLDPGVTVIHGPNGAGKSSLLEACFFALYGHRALEKNLDEVVTIGADGARIDLWFSHAGRDYHVEREVTVRATPEQGQPVEFRAQVGLLTPKERQYYRHGGILQYVLRQLARTAETA